MADRQRVSRRDISDAEEKPRQRNGTAKKPCRTSARRKKRGALFARRRKTRGLRRVTEKILIWPDCDGGRKSRSIDLRCASKPVVSCRGFRKRPWDITKRYGGVLFAQGSPSDAANRSRKKKRRKNENSYSPVVLLWCNSLPESGLKEDGRCEGPLSMLLVPRVRPEV